MAFITDPNQRMARVQSMFDMKELERYGISYDPVKNAFVFASQPGWSQDASTGVISGPNGQSATRPYFDMDRSHNSAIAMPDVNSYRQRQTAFNAAGVPDLPNPFAMRQTRSLGEQFLDVGKAIAPVAGGALLGAGLSGAFGGIGAGVGGGSFAPVIPESGLAGAQFGTTWGAGIGGGIGAVPAAATGAAATGAGAAAAGGGLSSILGGATAGGSMGFLDTIKGGLGSIGDFFGGGRGGDIIDLLGRGLSLYGGYQGYQTGRDVAGMNSDVYRQLLANMGQGIGAVGATGPGGAGGAFSGGVGTFGAGDLDPLRQLLTMYATGTVPGIGAGAAGLGNLPGYGTSMLDQAFAGLGPAFTGAMDAGAGQQDTYNNVLSRLREQAAPDETRAANAFLENQYATGQGSTTGGGILAEAFGRGLGQADVSRQLAAYGQSNQQRTLGDTLLNSAFNRFSNASNVYGNIAQLPAFMAGMNLDNTGRALTQIGGVNNLGLNNFQAALNAAIANANARVGAGSNLGSFVGGNNFGTNMLGPAAGLTQIGGSVSGMVRPNGQMSIGDLIGRILRPENA